MDVQAIMPVFGKIATPPPPKLWSQRSFDIYPGTNLTEPLSFYPLAVIVDNYSAYWLQVPDAGRFVPPYTVGAILPLIHAVQAYANWDNSPYGVQTVAATTSQIAHLTFTDDPNLTYGGGTSVGTQPLLVYYNWDEALNVGTPFGAVKTAWLPTDNKPSIVSGYLSATVRGTSPGAAEAIIRISLSDGILTYPIMDLIADESSPTRTEFVNPTPIQPVALDKTKQWSLWVNGLTVTGVPTLDYTWKVTWI